MRLNEIDKMRDLFAELPDELLPSLFNEKVMAKVHFESSRRAKRNKRWEIFGYITGGLAMITVCILILASMGVSFEIPSLELIAWSFPKLDLTVFKSQSFLGSLYVGMLALILLISDSIIRRHIAKHKK
jgi:hypothetical protein